MGGPPAQAEPADTGKFIDLVSKMDKSDCYARNEAAGFPMTNLFIGDTRLGCKSDADEQLIIHIGFQEFVKVSAQSASQSLHIQHPRSARWQVGLSVRFLVHNTNYVLLDRFIH